MKKCPFCGYEDKSAVVYEDDLCFAAISHRPINKHHIMVIPKEHHESFIELPDDLASHIFLVAKKLSAALRKAVNPAAIMHLSDDEVSGEGYNLVAHYKLHIIPRFENDKIVIEWNRDEDPGLEVRSGYAGEITSQLGL